MLAPPFSRFGSYTVKVFFLKIIAKLTQPDIQFVNKEAVYLPSLDSIYYLTVHEKILSLNVMNTRYIWLPLFFRAKALPGASHTFCRSMFASVVERAKRMQ